MNEFFLSHFVLIYLNLTTYTSRRGRCCLEELKKFIYDMFISLFILI